jgi:2-hydroxychromene-2-carboxylate isomerase
MGNENIAVDFYFDPVSPFAYLLWKSLAQDHRGLALRPVPIVFGAVLDHWGQRGPAEIGPKRLHTYRYCQWLADRLGIPFRFPPAHPFRSLEAMRLIVASGATHEAVDAVFDAVFAKGLDISNVDILDSLGRQLGIDNVATAIAVPAVKEELRGNTEAAISRGVFGVPTLAVGGELFWGFDALEMALDYAADHSILATDEMRRLENLPVGAARKGTQ